MGAIPRGNGGAGAIPRGGSGTQAMARNGLTGAMAQPRNGATGTTPIPRPGSQNLVNLPGQVNDPRLAAQIQQLLPGLLAHAPTVPGERGGPPTPDMNWVTNELRKAGVPLQDNQHVMPGGWVREDPGWWDKWGKGVALALSPGLAGWGVGAAMGLGGGEAAAAASPWEIGPTTAANFTGGALGPSTAASMAGTDAALTAPAAISGAGLGPVAGGAAGAAAGAAGGGGGFLSTLGKLGTGVLGALGKVGGPLAVTAGSIENQRAAALAAAAKIQQQQDYLAQQRALLALKAPGMEAANSVRGDVLANSQDATFSGLPSYIHIPTMEGGLRPSMLSDNSRQLGGVMSRNALANQLSGKDVPELTPLPTGNGTDTLLQGLTLGGGFLNALSGLQGSSPSSPGGSSPPPSGGGYQGPGTSGFPGDGVSPVNNPLPPVDPNQGIDPNDMAWWAQQAGGGFA